MFKKLGLSLFAVLLSLAAAEVVVRAAGAAPKIYLISKGRFQLSKNPKLGYEPAPLAYQGNELAFYDYKGTSNSLGFRDVEHAVTKPPGVYRIVVLGDSVAMGLHVDRSEEIFPRVLEGLLDQRGLKAEVINLAVSGYNTQQEVEMLAARGLRYRPDLVLLAYTLSSREHIDGDILKTLLEEEQRKREGVSGARVDANPVLLSSALYRLLRFRVLAGTRPRPPDPESALAMVSRDTVAEYFGVLDDLSKKHRFDVLVAVIPRFVRSFHAYRLAAQHAYARQLAERHGFHYVDLIDAFSRCRDASSVPIELDNFHPSAYGHRCAAEALAGVIREQIVRPAGVTAHTQTATAPAPRR
jgi:lysophospholipase L1-like esterase